MHVNKYKYSQSDSASGEASDLQRGLAPSNVPRGGARVLKVGANSASKASRKIFGPHFLASGGTKYGVV